MSAAYTTAERVDLIRRADRGKVIVNGIWPPVPSRQFDYAAHFDDDEPNDDGQMMMGYGTTEIEAIDALLLSWEETHCRHCGRKDAFAGPCQFGGCPLGADL